MLSVLYPQLVCPKMILTDSKILETTYSSRASIPEGSLQAVQCKYEFQFSLSSVNSTC